MGMTIKLKANFSFRSDREGDEMASKGPEEKQPGGQRKCLLSNVCEGMEKQKLSQLPVETPQVKQSICLEKFL